MADSLPNFEAEAQQPRPSLLAEFSAYVVANQKWWLLPVLAMLLLLGALIALSSTGLAPFIYPLF